MHISGGQDLVFENQINIENVEDKIIANSIVPQVTHSLQSKMISKVCFKPIRLAKSDFNFRF